MAIYKATLFFEYGSNGWSESIYADGSGLNVGHQLTDLAEKRAKFLASDVRIITGRTCAVGPPRDVFISNFGPNGIAGAITGPPEDAFTAFLWNISGADGSRRYWTTRGIPDDWVLNKLLTTAGVDGVNSKAKPWREAIRAGGFWAIKTNAAANLPKIIDNLTKPLQTGQIRLTFNVAPGWASNDLISIKGVKSNRLVNGTWRVYKVDELTGLIYTLIGSERFGIGDQQTLATGRKVTPAVSLCDACSFVRVASRQTGRVPFGVPRGRRSARVVHH